MEKFEPGLYNNVNEPQELIVMKIQLACRSGLDEDLAYKITKAIYTHLDELGNHHAAAKLIKLTTAHKVAIPLNKGAEKFFRETGNIK